MMKPWQTLLNKAPNKGEKQKQRERERERGPKSLAEAQKPHRESQRGKGTTSYVQEPPLVSRSILEKKSEGNLQAQNCSCDHSSLLKAFDMGPITWALLSIASLQWAKYL
jgi:nitrate reductase cytochrome c-type subunit